MRQVDPSGGLSPIGGVAVGEGGFNYVVVARATIAVSPAVDAIEADERWRKCLFCARIVRVVLLSELSGCAALSTASKQQELMTEVSCDFSLSCNLRRRYPAGGGGGACGGFRAGGNDLLRSKLRRLMAPAFRFLITRF